MVEPNTCPVWVQFKIWMETEALPRTKIMFVHVALCENCQAKIHESKDIQMVLKKLNLTEEDLLNILKGIANGGA